MKSATVIDSDEDLVAHAVRELATRTRFPVAFGGLVEDGTVTVTNILGSRTPSLQGLKVRRDRGLGGRAMAELRPRMTSDYRASRQITHDYDAYVLGEGLSTLLAVPIIVAGRPRGVLYAGAWEEAPIGGVTTAPAMEVAAQIAAELRVRDEVDRRMRELAPRAHTFTPAHREDLRESFAELRSISSEISDAGIRERLTHLETRLLSLAGETVSPPTAPITAVRLSPRETDVLACAALGSTNAEIALQLGLREGTVKAYLGTAMSKLDASTRHAAVARARRAGILP